jgi:hypothetical protein
LGRILQLLQLLRLDLVNQKFVVGDPSHLAPELNG